MMLVILLPGVIMAINVQERKTTNRFKKALLFPFKLIYVGIRSIEIPCFTCNNNATQYKEKFIEMKRYEMSFEATLQILFNITLILNMLEAPWTVFVTLSLSMLSLLAGLFEQTNNSADQQQQIQIKLAGKIVCILIIINTMLAIVAFFGTLSGFFNDFSASLSRRPTSFYIVISCLLRIIIGLGCTIDEVIYMVKKGRQRTVHLGWPIGLKSFLHHMFQPSLISLDGPIIYIEFIAMKLFPLVLYVVLQCYYLLTEYLIKFFVVILCASIGLDSLLALLYTIYLIKSNFFFVKVTSEDIGGDAQEKLESSCQQETPFNNVNIEIEKGENEDSSNLDEPEVQGM